MGRFNAILRRIFAIGAGLSMSLVFAIIFVNSVRRYTVGRSVEWGEELPIYLTIYGVMFGAALAYSQDRHIRFTILTDFLSDHRRRQLFTVVDAVMVIVGLTLAYSGHVFALRRGSVDSSGMVNVARSFAESTGLETLIWIGHVGTYQYAMAIGGLMLAIAAGAKFFERLGTLKEA
ncbi:MAG: TRAP transporter small permease subunit [Ruegeria sp.]|nr:TRAP transporter small permease subunit [Ruegeria sp.]